MLAELEAPEIPAATKSSARSMERWKSLETICHPPPWLPGIIRLACFGSNSMHESKCRSHSGRVRSLQHFPIQCHHFFPILKCVLDALIIPFHPQSTEASMHFPMHRSGLLQSPPGWHQLFRLDRRLFPWVHDWA